MSGSRLGKIIVFDLLVLLSVGVSGQHRLDLVTAPPKPTARETTGGTSMGAGTAGMAGAQAERPQLEVTLVSVDRQEYRLGGPVVFEISVKNTGSSSLLLPWSTEHLGSSSGGNPDEGQLRMYLAVVDGSGNEHRLTGVTLYGSQNEPATTVELSPSETANLKAPGWLMPDSRFRQGVTGRVQIRGGIWLSLRRGVWTQPLLSVNSQLVLLGQP